MTKLIMVLALVFLGAYAFFAFDIPYKKPVDSVQTNGTTNINVLEPKAGAAISSPVKVSGQARGYYFEASFPVQVLDMNGKVLGAGPAQAQSDWMTADFVPFSASIDFNPGTSTSGFVRFNKDNPSGEPSMDEHFDVPVKFNVVSTSTTTNPIAKACVIGGCSGEICADESMVSNCMYREAFACYKTAECKRQATGKCGWTDTAELKACLIKNK